MVLTSSLISYYKCDSSTNFLDAHGSNDGTVNGATYTGSGLINGAYDYDGNSDYIDLVDDMLDSYNEGTLNMWFNPDSSSITQDAFAVGSAGSINPVVAMRVNTDNTLTYVFRNDGAGGLTILDTSDAITTGQFNMVTFTSNGSTIKCYIDGVEKTLTASLGTNTGQWFSDLGVTHTHRYHVGAAATPTITNYCDGVIDEIGLWSRALSQSEITSLYNGGSGFAYPFVEGYSKTIIGISSYSKVIGVPKEDFTKFIGVS